MFFLHLPDTVETKHQYEIVASWNRQKTTAVGVGEINRPDTDHDGAASVGRSVGLTSGGRFSSKALIDDATRPKTRLGP